LQSYTVKLYGEEQKDTVILDVKSKKILQGVRDGVYRAMGPSRQINVDTPTVSFKTCEDQEDKAAKEKVVNSVVEGCCGCCGIGKKTKLVTTKE